MDSFFMWLSACLYILGAVVTYWLMKHRDNRDKVVLIPIWPIAAIISCVLALIRKAWRVNL